MRDKDMWELERHDWERERRRAEQEMRDMKKEWEWEREKSYQERQREREEAERWQRIEEERHLEELDDHAFNVILELVKTRQIIVTAEYMKTLTPERKKLIVEAVCLSKV